MSSILKKSKSHFILFFIGFAFNIANAQNPLIQNIFMPILLQGFLEIACMYIHRMIFLQQGMAVLAGFAWKIIMCSLQQIYRLERYGIVVTQNKVPWVKPDSYSMWAPDCIDRNGKYYFYFPIARKIQVMEEVLQLALLLQINPRTIYGRTRTDKRCSWN